MDIKTPDAQVDPNAPLSQVEELIKGDNPLNSHADKKDDEPSPNCEEKRMERTKMVRVDQIWDKKTRKFRFVKTAKPQNRKEKFARYIITVARRISAQGVFTGEYQVDIRGQYIREILSDIYSDVDGVSFPQVISLSTEELRLLFHARMGLLAALKDARMAENLNEALIFELEAVLEFISEHFGKVLLDIAELPEGQITFEHIWTLFRPYIMVYGTDGLKQGRVFRVKSSNFGKNDDGSIYYALKVDYIDSSGERTGYVSPQIFKINAFEGSIPVHRLSYFPIALHPEYHDLRKGLIARGERWITLQGRHLQEYKGLALHEEDRELKKFNSHGRVMLDPAIFDQVQPNNRFVPYIETPIRNEELTPEQKMMHNTVLYGFSFGDKIWGAFAISGLEKVEWNENIIESLVLAPERKDFIWSLVRTHGLADKTQGFDDFVRDKGKGLIGLLSGPPGVGKTLTAEAVAEIAHRPLYMVSSGELGDTSASVQRSLAKVLELAEAWNAVVLLDEADVFLAKRDNISLIRNAVTSIFLRHLEYYQGILLLTTNRLTSFDSAFQSRIHFCFEYENLDPNARFSIWEKFLQKAEATAGVEVNISRQALRQLAELDLNGRQIKNCMSISQAVATEKKRALDVECIRLAISFANIQWHSDSPASDTETATSASLITF